MKVILQRPKHINTLSFNQKTLTSALIAIVSLSIGMPVLQAAVQRMPAADQNAITAGSISNFRCPTVPNFPCGSSDICAIVMRPDNCYITYLPLGVWKCNGATFKACRLWTNLRKECVQEQGPCCTPGQSKEGGPCGNKFKAWCKPNPHFGEPNCSQCATVNIDEQCISNCK